MRWRKVAWIFGGAISAIALSLVAVSGGLESREGARAHVHVAASRIEPAQRVESVTPASTLAATSAPPPGEEDDLSQLRAALVVDDDAAKIAAVEAVAKGGVVAALPVLDSVDLSREPEAAPAIIQGIAALGARGSRVEHASAERALARWLRTEIARDTRDAAGNVVSLVEALGDLGGSDAVQALIALLDDERIDLSVDTLAIQKLAALGDPRALAAVQRFAARIENGSTDDSFEQQLRKEALEAAAAAALRLGGPRGVPENGQ